MIYTQRWDESRAHILARIIHAAEVRGGVVGACSDGGECLMRCVNACIHQEKYFLIGFYAALRRYSDALLAATRLYIALPLMQTTKTSTSS